MSKKKHAVIVDEQEQLRAQLAAAGVPLGKAEGHAPVPTKPDDGILLAQPGMDPHTMPVKEIVFDERLLDGFPSLKAQRKEAADHVFALYKSRGRDKDRNSLLWSEVGKFIVRVQRSRETGVKHVKEAVKASKKERDLLALLREHGISTVEDLTQMLGQEEGK